MGYLKKVLRQRKLQQIQTESFKRFYNCAFWHWDISPEAHAKAYDNTNGRCCFNHLIGLPVKNSVSHPIYSWQREVFNALQQNKLITILKARGVGATELLLRYALWLCVKDNQMQGKNIAVVTGIRENLSLELLNRFRNLLPTYDWQTGASSHVAEINGCRIIGYPSKRVKDLRGLTDVSLCIVDEFAFFDPVDKQQILPVLEALQAKSNPTICLLSTPGPIGDELYNIFQEPAQTCRFKRLYIPIQKALGTLISEEEAAKVKRQGNYEQEFELRFGSYGSGSIFNIADIDRAVRQGKEYYENHKFDPKAAEAFFIGVDPSGLSNSKHALCMVALLNKIHIVVSEVYGANEITEDEFMRRIIALKNKTPYPRQTKIFIDSANISFIKRLKGLIPGERAEDYQEYFEDLRRRKLIRPPDEAELVHFTDVIPISFAKRGSNLLASLYAFLQRGDFVIPPKFSSLIADLQSARNVPNRNNPFVLEKTQQQSMDAVDSLRLAIANLDAGAPEFEIKEEEGEIYVQQ